MKKCILSAKGQLRLIGDRCHLSWWKEKVNYPTEDRLQQKEKTQRFLFEKAGDNKDIFISTVLIVEAIRYFLSAVRTFL